MKTGLALDDIRQQLGADRVLDPPGALPQPAERLDPSGPVRPYEFEVAVERLCLDSTSHRSIRERRAGRRRTGWRRGSSRSSTSRGKLHNPDTDSGGILLGTVAAVGERFESPPPLGDADRDARLADPDAAAARRGHAGSIPTRRRSRSREPPTCSSARPGRRCPTTCRWRPRSRSTTSAPPPRRRATLAPRERHRLRARRRPRGQAGARRGPRRRRRAGRWSPSTSTRRRSSGSPSSGLCDVGVTADLRDPLAALDGGARRRASPPADLTVVVVNATGCEPTAILLTAEGGTVLFFSMATSFSAAALAADGIGAERPDAGRQRLLARPRRLRARARSRLGGAARGPRLSGGGDRRERRRATGCRCAGATSTGSATSTTRVVLTYLEEGRDAFLKRARDPPRRVRGRALLGQLPRRDRPGASRR